MALTNKVIFINDVKQEDEKPVEFTHSLDTEDGWEKHESDMHYSPQECEKVFYLGRCASDGDMFSATLDNGDILIFKGHLNSGKY